MKKFILPIICVAALMSSSCSTIRRTSTDVPVRTEVTSMSKADLQVAQKKITFIYRPTRAVRRGGEKNVIRTAVAEALKANGNADVLVGMQYEIKKTRNFFGHTSIKYVVVEGYPATYVNITPVTCPEHTCKK